MRWFVERVLRARDLDPDPEPFARGGLAHAALRDTFEGLRARTGSARLTPARLALARELLVQALGENEPDYPLSVAPERRQVARRRLQWDLDRYLQHAASAEAHPLEPSHFELEFGFASDGESDDAAGLPPLDLGGGVMLRGRIDRVDVGDSGEAVVYDYKGANVLGAAKWLPEGNVQLALYMRAVGALLHLPVAGGFYQPLTGSDLRARGVLDGERGVQIECVGGDRQSPAQMAALLQQVVALAREAAAQAGRGELQARPQTCAFKGGCSYPTICRSQC